MSVNIFGSSGKHASGVNSNVGLGGVDRNFNQRLIMLSNKLAQKINKSGDTMEGDLKFVLNQNQHVIRYLWVWMVWTRLTACRYC